MAHSPRLTVFYNNRFFSTNRLALKDAHGIQMGQKRQRLLRFLADHPNCCFCGGDLPATTQDHLPPKGIFDSRRWPEGYEFPACTLCNSGSSSDDAIVALFSRINHAVEPTDSSRQEWLRQLRAFNEIYPGETRKLLLTANEKRRWLKDRGIEKPEGMAVGELPMLKFTPLVREAIDRFARKLTLALRYKHTGKIVPRDAWILTRFWTNAHRIANEFPQELFDILPGTAKLRRDNRSLSEQFSYRFGTSEDGKLGGYLAAFRRSFVTVGLLNFDAQSMLNIDGTALDSALSTATGEAPT